MSASEVLTNILPKDGIAIYYGCILSTSDASIYQNNLLHSIQWYNDEITLFGKQFITKREVAWYGNKGLEYTYSHTTKKAIPWTSDLLKLKEIAEKITGETFNSCLLNLYHNGHEGMGWHSDNEKELKRNGAIASISLGAERKFIFRHKLTGEKITLILENGSLLLMKGNIQTHWLHSLPVSKKITTPRINLTFRTIGN